MKFSDIKFYPQEGNEKDGIQALIDFPNGYGASIIQSKWSYGGSKGLYELAVLGKDGFINYKTGITDDVLGCLTEDNVLEYLEKIGNLS